MVAGIEGSTMTETKPMTPKRLLRLLGGAKSAIGFIEAHRQYLATGELAEITSPILAKVDAKLVMPTPALGEIQAVIWSHCMATDLAKAEASMLKGNGESKDPPAFEAKVLDAEGNIQFRTTESGEEKELVQGFKMPQDAERWCHRQLDAGAPGWHAEITWAHCPEKLLQFKVRRIERDTAIQAMLRKGPGPVMHVTKVGAGGGLGFGVKVKQTVAKFSRG
jgi:hypothetical protein